MSRTTKKEHDPNLRQYFYDSPVPMWEMDISGLPPAEDQTLAPGTQGALLGAIRTTRVNQAMLDLLGASDAQTLHSHISDIYRDKAYPALMACLRAVQKGRHAHTEDAAQYRLDGTRLDVRVHVTASGEPDVVSRVLMTVTDMTSTGELRRQVNLLSTLPETNPDIVIVMDCPNKIIYANPATQRWLAEHHCRDVNDIHALLPQDFRRTECDVCDKLSGRTSYVSYEDTRYMLHITPVKDSERCMITLADVTEIERLRREREIYFRALEATSNAIFITDADGAIEYVNPAFVSMYGYSKEEALGLNPRVLNPGRAAYRDLGFDESDYERLFGDMWQRIRRDGSFTGELPNRLGNGQIAWVDLFVSRVTDPAGTEKYLAIAVDIDEIRRREQEVRLEIFQTITRVGELRDNETGKHMTRVGLFARRLAEALEMPNKFCEDMENFAPFHDIGKVGIRDTILLAPRRLTEAEFGEMQEHTTLGFGILSDKPTMEVAAEIAHCHHERYDSSGYPRGIGGDKIPLSAQLVALADVYDALRSRRPYKPPWTHSESVKEILRSEGTHFSPEIMTAFREACDDLNRISRASLTDLL